MARVSVSLYEEGDLPVDIQEERFAFGSVVYLTVGGFTTAEMVCMQLSPAQLSAVAAAIDAYRGGAAGQGGEEA